MINGKSRQRFVNARPACRVLDGNFKLGGGTPGSFVQWLHMGRFNAPPGGVEVAWTDGNHAELDPVNNGAEPKLGIRIAMRLQFRARMRFFRFDGVHAK